MKHRLIVAALVAAVAFAGAAAHAGGKGLTPAEIDDLESSIVFDATTTALVNAVTNNDTRDLAFSRELVNDRDDVFNVVLDAKGITNQERTGRCWLFAGFNVMRPAVMEKYNLDSFEFSQSHLFFWDKLEKANMFLDAIALTADRPIDDREVQALLSAPVPDGGWWNYVVSLVEKYGAVPKSVAPETRNSSDTRRVNHLLDRMMRVDAVELRGMVAEGAEDAAIDARRREMMRDVYRVLVLHMGPPPKEFVWRYKDKDERIVEKEYTPRSFYEEAVGVDLRDYVALFDHPAYPYDALYRINFCRNMTGMGDMAFVNVGVDRLREFALKAVLSDEPVWFAADVGKDHDSKAGILRPGVYDYASLFGVDLSMSKADRVRFRDTTPNHAMVFIGVDHEDGEPVKWLVENSWGTDRGDGGRWTMYDGWFTDNVFSVIVHKRHLPRDVLSLLDTEPAILPAWDPMRRAFDR